MPTGKPGRPQATDIDAHVGSNLKLYRQAQNLTQEKLASAIGITFQQIQKYEQGKNRISASRMYEIAQILNITVADFFRGIEEEDHQNTDILHNLDKDTVEILSLFQNIQDKSAKESLLNILRAYKER